MKKASKWVKRIRKFPARVTHKVIYTEVRKKSRKGNEYVSYKESVVPV